jgi:hypothetical protein
MPDLGDADAITNALDQLHRAGWSIGDTAFTTTPGSLAVVVFGSNGENLIRAEGPTCGAAWLAALDQARTLGMLGGIRPGDPQVG